MARTNAGMGSISAVAAPGPGHISDTDTAYGAGKIHSFLTDAVEKAYVDFEGSYHGRHILPTVSDAYDLGANGNWWRKAWVSELSANGTGTFALAWRFTGNVNVSGSMAIEDSVEFKFGNGRDLWMTYNAAGTAFEFWSTTGGGGAADGLVFSVQDGGDDIVFAGKATATDFIGTIGQDTPAAGAFTTLGSSGACTLDSGAVGSSFGGALTVTGDLVVSGTGPHAIGGAASGVAAISLKGAFTSDGSSSVALGLDISHALTGAAGDTGWLTGTRMASTIVTQTAAETIGDVSQLRLEEPTITKNVTTITNASTLLITGAPTEGAANWGIRLVSGATYLGGTLAVTGNVGIGQAAGGEALNVTEAAANAPALRLTSSHASTPMGQLIHFSNDDPNDTTQYFLSMHDSAGLQAVIYSDGSYEGSANSYGALSDLRLKTNVVPMESTWDQFLKLDWISFEKNGKSDYGLGAQPTQEIFPDCVYQSGDYLAINYMGIATKTGRTLQEAMQRIEVLETKLAALKAA